MDKPSNIGLELIRLIQTYLTGQGLGLWEKKKLLFTSSATRSLNLKRPWKNTDKKFTGIEHRAEQNKNNVAIKVAINANYLVAQENLKENAIFQ